MYPEPNDYVKKVEERNKAKVLKDPSKLGQGWNCPNCQSDNDDGIEFCEACGNPNPELD